MVRPVAYDGLNSNLAWVEIMDWIKVMSESTAYPNPLRQNSFQWCGVKPISSMVYTEDKGPRVNWVSHSWYEDIDFPHH